MSKNLVNKAVKKAAKKASKKPGKGKAGATFSATSSLVGHDARNREVKVVQDGKFFRVQREATGYLSDPMSKDEALVLFDHELTSSH